MSECMVASVVGIVLALLASLAWGVSDFLGGMAAGSARLIFVLVGGRDALIGYALAGTAAIGVGSVLTLLDAASRAGALWAAGALRVGGAVTAMVALACAPVPRRVARAQLARAHRLLAMIVAVGVSDAVADLACASAARRGQLSVVAVLASLYPVATIGLGAIVLRERPARVQLLGAALALGGVAVLGAATH
jgi:drug/metabolite transporter (DMT)-like permease